LRDFDPAYDRLGSKAAPWPIVAPTALAVPLSKGGQGYFLFAGGSVGAALSEMRATESAQGGMGERTPKSWLMRLLGYA
jgi:hypothetical protein